LDPKPILRDPLQNRPTDFNMSDPGTRREVMDALQTIEQSICFDRVSNSTIGPMANYSTGISPRYYDGPFDTKKRCPFLQWNYICREGFVAQKGFPDWTMMIHPQDFQGDDATEGLLRVLQREHGYYQQDLFEYHFQKNLKALNSLFIRPTNVLMFGNSWMRQMFESMLCMMHSTPHFKNAVVGLQNKNLRKCDENKPITVDVRDQWCTGKDFNYSVMATSGSHMKPKLNRSEVTTFWQKEMWDHNVCSCDDWESQIQLADGSNIMYAMQHWNHNKTLRGTMEYLKSMGRAEGVDVNDLDVIVMNRGNGKMYDWNTSFAADLEYLGHTEKPVIYIEPFRHMGESGRMRPEIEDLRRRFPNLLYISYDLRHFRVMPRSNLPHTTWQFWHLCQPGPPSHHALNVIHLINVLEKLEMKP